MDNMRSRAILDTICGHLSTEDQLTLEDVTQLARRVVSTHHSNQIVSLGPHAQNNLTGQLMDLDGRRLRGPIITRAAVNLCLNLSQIPDSEPTKNELQWRWWLSAIAQRADTLKQLKLKLQAWITAPVLTHFPPSSDQMRQQAETLLSGVTFTACTHLSIVYQLGTTNLTNLLSYFPALESLDLEGCNLPPINCLPAPHKLKNSDLKPTRSNQS